MTQQDEIEGRAEVLPAVVNDLLVALNFIGKLGYPGSVRAMIVILFPGDDLAGVRASGPTGPTRLPRPQGRGIRMNGRNELVDALHRAGVGCPALIPSENAEHWVGHEEDADRLIAGLPVLGNADLAENRIDRALAASFETGSVHNLRSMASIIYAALLAPAPPDPDSQGVSE
jgi:hypothetical protein